MVQGKEEEKIPVVSIHDGFLKSGQEAWHRAQGPERETERLLRAIVLERRSEKRFADTFPSSGMTHPQEQGACSKISNMRVTEGLF